MDREIFDMIASVAINVFDDSAVGLHAMLSAGKDIQSFFSDLNRIDMYKKLGFFNMSQNERNFHLIGFMDAIVWLNEIGALVEPPQEDFSDVHPAVRDLVEASTSDGELIQSVLNEVAHVRKWQEKKAPIWEHNCSRLPLKS